MECDTRTLGASRDSCDARFCGATMTVLRKVPWAIYDSQGVLIYLTMTPTAEDCWRAFDAELPDGEERDPERGLECLRVSVKRL